jgi:hypothetical protein
MRTSILITSVSLLAVTGCGGLTRAHSTLKVTEMTNEMAGPKRLTHSVFAKPKDRENLKEEDIARVLDAPVEIELPARAGLVVLDAPFSRAAYAHLEPGDRAPQLLARAIEKSRHFKLVTDISPLMTRLSHRPAYCGGRHLRRGQPAPASPGHQPAFDSAGPPRLAPGHLATASGERCGSLADGQHVEGLRELAARYRLKYLVVLTRRFADRSHVNGFGWAWLSVVGIPFAPAYTLRTEGLFEASLMDVRTGTFLFTTQVHTQAWKRDTPFGSDRAMCRLKRTASLEAVKVLARRFMARCDRLGS